MAETVSNTSPLLYLHQLRLLETLPALFGRVAVPPEVLRELAEGRRLGHDAPDIEGLAWVDVQTPDPTLLARVDVALGAGERAAIALALALPGATVILDDAEARAHAAVLGIAVVGTLGTLIRAKARGHIERVGDRIDHLERLGFRISPATRAAVLALAGE